MEKPKIEHVEEGHASSLSESSAIPYLDRLSAEQRGYLLGRHGTLNFSPVPSMSDADPFNWPAWKVSKSLIPFHSRYRRRTQPQTDTFHTH